MGMQTKEELDDIIDAKVEDIVPKNRYKRNSYSKRAGNSRAKRR